MAQADSNKILVCTTGASGMLFLRALLKVLDNQDVTVHGICSSSGRKVLGLEEGIKPDDLAGVRVWFDEKDFTAPPASGSACYKSMVILPCSMGTLGAIAGGLSMNLIHRAADVMLKERRRLILGVRETPLNRSHLENMLKAHDNGAVIMPPLPAFYFKPKTLEEAAITYAWRVAEKLGLVVAEARQWGES